MRRFGTALAVMVVAIALGAGCNDTGNTFQGNTGAVIRFLAPSNVSAGGPDFTLTLTGAGFVQKTVVQWNGSNLVTTFVDSTSVTAVVPAALTKTSGTATVNTLNPSTSKQDNGLSNPVAFQITQPPNPVPTVSSISPTSAVAGSTTVGLTITGTNFLPASDPSGGSQVHWNFGTTQTTLKASSITATSITVAAADFTPQLTVAGTAVVTVFNPPAPNSAAGGGGTSANGPTFTICATTCPATQNAAKTVNVIEETPAVSADGRFVAFTATQAGHAQVFLRDTCEGAAGCIARTTLLSATEENLAADADSRQPSISSDGRFVAFSSAATNLVSGAPQGRQIYLRDTCAGADGSCKPATKLISSDENGALAGTESVLPSVSASGRFVAFVAVTASHTADQSAAAKQSANSGLRQVFVRDTCLGAANCTPRTMRISMMPGDVSAPSGALTGPALSGNAKFVAASGGGVAAFLTRSVAVDDRVFLAVTGREK